MASDVDICNAALSYLGCEANVSSINPAEGGEYAERCAREFPICRDLLLESSDWSFASKREALALLYTNKSGWDYCYGKPSDCSKVLSIIEQDDKLFEHPFDFLVEVDAETGKEVILTDCKNAFCRFMFYNTNTTQYPEKFGQALSLLLASRLAGSIIRGKEGTSYAEAMMKLYATTLQEAKMLDAKQRRYKNKEVASWTKFKGWRQG